MIFMQDDLELNLLDVLYFNETNAANMNRMRGYSALSNRYESDVVGVEDVHTEDFAG